MESTTCLVVSDAWLLSPAKSRLSSCSLGSLYKPPSSNFKQARFYSALLKQKRPLKKAFHICKRSHVSICMNDDGSGKAEEKPPFGYTRKDVLLIGLGLTVVGVGLKYGLEFVGVDSLKAGNVVQIVMVLGLTIGWISTYVFRVSNKEMTYAKQLEDYENKVIQKRLEELPEADLESLLAQVEEEKQQLRRSRDQL